ncbi:MAG: hypothetical protein WDM92_06305 [Caulobacteraceae bacterium]
MTYKVNRRNHDFQIAHFVAGRCHTPDAAWSQLYAQRDERRGALASYRAESFRLQARRIRAEARAGDGDEAEQLEARADLMEVAEAEAVGATLAAAAEAELAFIECCMAALEPHRVHRGLPDAEAHEAAQAREWELELCERAENYILTSGSIPADELATMRRHPAFSASILPTIERAREAVQKGALDALAAPPGLDATLLALPKPG